MMKRKFLFAALIFASAGTLVLNSCSKDDDDDDNGNNVDLTDPVISLNGSATVNVTLNSSYTDSGATAMDAVDGAVAVTTDNPVNVDSAATYTVTYTASDNSGNTATATRTVNVVIERSNYVWAGYAAVDSGFTSGAFIYSGSISAGSNADEIIMTNFSGTLQNCVATVNGANITIPSQQVGIFTIVGSGTMNYAGDVLTINYNDGTEGHIAVFTKQ